MPISKQVKGGRKAFFDDPQQDRLLAMMTRLMAEHWALRERLLTVEALLAERGSITAADIESFSPDPALEAEWNQSRDDMIRAVFEFGQNIQE